ncbi:MULTISPECIES: hypothetical protein [Mesonia]|uniref:Uncharacterized protein n=1 Tax=Mesonia oceanica TaxID=2687242 RepID=A0AC61Y883_9FLAO|nr:MULTISPECIES: hypothetical protein [Mesonia]MAN27668.1 hypothetical protein [Mesonia sp.]MAQ40273.1 hypothetical protein [Mesonia sp.]MBJ97183.1 hypothetical protein [Flavobacteriaceae bacterium]VVV00704.1 hypothetical protein FVB9532_01978 [Mesonia oceanica]|tara:strand:- start:15928 stop:16557 length:630 start_codon:yes stop_codon:yes gene_type:complete
MKFSQEFKEAVLHLSESEKDKLLIRLLKKDENLVNRLYFELIDDQTVDDHRLKLETRVAERAKEITGYAKSLNHLKMLTRYLSGEISEHVRITKDRFGEVSLNILMLNNLLQQSKKLYKQSNARQAQKFNLYVIVRTYRILIHISKMHEDLHMEFEEGLAELGELIAELPTLMHMAIQNGLDVNWLIQNQIPEDIAQYHKDLKAQGFLK